MSIFGSDSDIVAAAMAGDEPAEVAVPPRRRRLRWRPVLQTAGALLIAVVLAVLVNGFLVQTFTVASPSMGPTLALHDRLLVNKLSYRLHEIRRGDIVVFERPATAVDPNADLEADDLVKRVIALPGETVVIRDDHVEIDGRVLDEPWLVAGTPTKAWDRLKHYDHTCSSTDPCRIPEGTVWVMGDNRTNSQDSRYFGPLPDDLVVGRAMGVFWPLVDRRGL